MKTAAVGGSDKKSNMGGLSIFLRVIALVISSGCIDMQEGVKINLDKTEERVVRVLENDTDVVYAGECDTGWVQDAMASALADAGKLTIVAFSEYYPSGGIPANKDVDPALLEAVKSNA